MANSRVSGWSWRLLLFPMFCALFYISSAQHIIPTLPGFNGSLPFTLETGYIGVGERQEVQLFYYFIESDGNPETDPLIFWLTGGPGCSALYSIFYEIGPIQFDDPVDDGKLPTLHLNPYSWTRFTNIIFIDAPVGTGFSYTTLVDYKLTDKQNANDDYEFLRNWLVAHPRFSNNPVYIGGDSYGGQITPMVAYLISKGNEAGDKPSINLKGYHIGNPVTNIECDLNARVPYANGMAILPDEYYELLKSSCKGVYYNPDMTNSLCLNYLHIFDELTNGLNYEHILEPYCPTWVGRVEKDISTYNVLKLSPNAFKSKCWVSNDALAEQWTRDPIVQEAIHVRQGTLKAEWLMCNRHITYDVYKFEDRAIEYHHILTASGYRALVYSGNQDLSYTYLGTLCWINKLNMTIDEYWRPWFVDQQVAGYTQKYKKDRFDMTFATVKGAGHTAPEYKPKECVGMFERWISQEEL